MTRSRFTLVALVAFGLCAADDSQILPPILPQAPSEVPWWIRLVDQKPCRRIGSFHKGSRARIEKLRQRHVISEEEWACMARELAALDEEVSASCVAEGFGYNDFVDKLRHQYVRCLPADRMGIVNEAAPPPLVEEP
jgi:hypothetical protein